jgi:hypothetical protein
VDTRLQLVTLGTQPDEGGVVQAALVEVRGHSPLWNCLILRGDAL